MKRKQCSIFTPIDFHAPPCFSRGFFSLQRACCSGGSATEQSPGLKIRRCLPRDCSSYCLEVSTECPTSLPGLSPFVGPLVPRACWWDTRRRSSSHLASRTHWQPRNGRSAERVIWPLHATPERSSHQRNPGHQRQRWLVKRTVCPEASSNRQTNLLLDTLLKVLKSTANADATS